MTPSPADGPARAPGSGPVSPPPLQRTGEPPPPAEAGGSPPPAPWGTVRRLGARAGLATIAFLDLLALEDLTTNGEVMPETGFLVVSVPALVVLAWYSFRRLPSERPEDDPGG